MATATAAAVKLVEPPIEVTLVLSEDEANVLVEFLNYLGDDPARFRLTHKGLYGISVALKGALG